MWKKFHWLRILVGIAIAGGAAIITIGLIYLIGFLSVCICHHPPKVWQCLFFDSDFDARNTYLLSATAQVLGAIFALVFSISLVAGQTVVRYTHRALTIIFNKWIFIYAVIFAGVIVGILWCIQYPTDILTPLALGVGGLFVLSIPVFIFYLIQRMNLQWMPQEFKRIGIKAIRNRVDEQAREMVEALDNIVTVALKEGNFEALEAAEEALVDLLLEVGRYHNDPQRKQPELHKDIYETLRVACLEAIDNPRVPRVIIGKLGEVGAKALKEWKGSVGSCEAKVEVESPAKAANRLPKTEYYAQNIIMVVAKACEKPAHARLLYYCAEAFDKMLRAAPTNEIEEEYICKLHWVYNRFYVKKWTDWYNPCKKDVEGIIRTYPDINTTLKNKLNKLKNALEKKPA